MLMASDAVFLLGYPRVRSRARSGHQIIKREETMLLFGRSRSRRGLASALTHCRNSRFTNPMRIDWICSMQQFSGRSPISSRLPEALPGTCMRSRRPKRNRRSCANSTRSTRKGKSTAFRNRATICCVTCENSSPKSSPRPYPELDGTARTQRVSSSLMHVIVVGRRRPAGAE